MRNVLLAFALILAACSSDETFTWRDVSRGLSQEYCSTLAQCGFISEQDVYDVCVEHTTFHLCEFDMTCDVEVDKAAARVALEKCNDKLMTLEPEDEACYLLGFWGYLPAECNDVFDLAPNPED